MTVHIPEGDAGYAFGWRHVTTGPCARCGTQATRYGPHGDECLPVGEWLAIHGLKQLPPKRNPE
jgi:hypothetical protein